MSTVSTTKMTAKQFLQLGQDLPGVRLELVDGEIAASPSPEWRHSRVEKRLSYLLLQHITEHDRGELLGDVDTILDAFDVRRPDILFVAKANFHLLKGKVVNGAPDLCVEIISPSSGRTDRKDKFRLYAAAGVPHYWIVDAPERTMDCYTLARGRYKRVASGKNTDVVTAPPFLKLKIPLAALWPATLG